MEKDSKLQAIDDLVKSAASGLPPSLANFYACPTCGYFLGADKTRLCPEHGLSIQIADLPLDFRSKVGESMLAQILKVIETNKDKLKRAQKQHRKEMKKKAKRFGLSIDGNTYKDINLDGMLAQIGVLERQFKTFLRGVQQKNANGAVPHGDNSADSTAPRQ